MTKASIIIAFYNKIDYLKLVLAGLGRQSMDDFEVIIADDGSRKEVVAELEELITESPLAIRHLWHEDKGFRKNRMLNRAIRESESDYLIFIDGDCIPHREFVKEHLDNSVIKASLTGRRVNLSQKITESLTPEKVRSGCLENDTLMMMSDYIFGKSTDVEKGVYLKSAYLREKINRKKRGLLGSNFSLFKSDFLEINGFDERYEAPSIGEDSDVQFRLELKGVEIRPLNNIAIQYHLYHKILPRPDKNKELFDRVIKEGRYFTPFGIKKESGL